MCEVTRIVTYSEHLKVKSSACICTHTLSDGRGIQYDRNLKWDLSDHM